MIKYYTKQFHKSSLEDIAEWLNSFEIRREGRPKVEYWLNIIRFDVLNDDSVLVTIEVFDYQK